MPASGSDAGMVGFDLMVFISQRQAACSLRTFWQTRQPHAELHPRGDCPASGGGDELQGNGFIFLIQQIEIK